MKRNNKKKGFTLVELLVVIAILAILASVTVVGYMGFTGKAKQSVAEQEAKQVETTIYGTLLDGESVVAGVTTNSTTPADDNCYLYTFSLNTDNDNLDIVVQAKGTPGDQNIANAAAVNKNELTGAIKAAFGLTELSANSSFKVQEIEGVYRLVYVHENTKEAVVGNFVMKVTSKAQL